MPLATTKEGSVIVTLVVAEQLLASLIVIVYVPAAKLENVELPWKLVPFLEYVYGAVPPDPNTVTEPALVPLQRLFVVDETETASAFAG